MDCWHVMQSPHSGLEASAGLSHTPAGQHDVQGTPPLQAPSPTPDMHAPSSNMQQPTAAHSDASNPLSSQASSPLGPSNGDGDGIGDAPALSPV